VTTDVDPFGSVEVESVEVDPKVVVARSVVVAAASEEVVLDRDPLDVDRVAERVLVDVRDVELPAKLSMVEFNSDTTPPPMPDSAEAEPLIDLLDALDSVSVESPLSESESAGI